MGDPCIQKDNICNVKDDIKELKDVVRAHADEISDLKEKHAETRVYVKQILERVDDLKVLFKAGTQSNNDTWTKIVTELIKAIGVVAAIVAGIKILG